MGSGNSKKPQVKQTNESISKGKRQSTSSSENIPCPFVERGPDIISHLLVESFTEKFGKSFAQTKQLVLFLKGKGISLTGEVLGYGGFGLVVKGFSHELYKFVAIKSILFNSKEEFESNIQEFNCQKSLKHQNILQAIEIYSLNELHMQFIVLELCQMDLYTHLKVYSSEGRWPNRTVIIELWAQLIEGLMFLHSKGMLHLDINSKNILLGVNNKWKITDFGLAHLLSDGESSIKNPVILLKQNNQAHFAYLKKGFNQSTCSPEQYIHNFLNREQTISKESDIYCLGLVFLQLTSVRLDKKKLIKMKTEKNVVNSILNPNYSIYNQELIKEMLHKNPKKRISLEEAKKLVNKYQQAERDKNKLSSFKSKSVPRGMQINTSENEGTPTKNNDTRRSILRTEPNDDVSFIPSNYGLRRESRFHLFTTENNNLDSNNNSPLMITHNNSQQIQNVISGLVSLSQNKKQFSSHRRISISSVFKQPRVDTKEQLETYQEQSDEQQKNEEILPPLQKVQALNSSQLNINKEPSTPYQMYSRKSVQLNKFFENQNMNMSMYSSKNDSNKLPSKQVDMSTSLMNSNSDNKNSDNKNSDNKNNNNNANNNYKDSIDMMLRSVPRTHSREKGNKVFDEISTFSTRRQISSRKLPPPSQIQVTLNEFQEKQTDLISLLKPVDSYEKNDLQKNVLKINFSNSKKEMNQSYTPQNSNGFSIYRGQRNELDQNSHQSSPLNQNNNTNSLNLLLGKKNEQEKQNFNYSIFRNKNESKNENKNENKNDDSIFRYKKEDKNHLTNNSYGINHTNFLPSIYSSSPQTITRKMNLVAPYPLGSSFFKE